MQRLHLHHAVAAASDAYAHLLAPDGTLRMPERRPAIYRMDGHDATTHEVYATWRETLPEERRVLVDRYRLRDVVFKAVGVALNVGWFM